jgi:FAD/FMN-containing dehydrogenase
MHGAAVAEKIPMRRDFGLERRLANALEGEVRFDAFTRGRYSTDASIYQIMPAGVVFPKGADDVAAAMAIAREAGVPVIARGGGTSQNGQPIGSGLVIDCSRHFNAVTSFDRDARTVTVEPGLVLEHLNARLKNDGLFFPVEPSTASRCTIGGMTGNNSCGARSIHYGKMVDNVIGASAFLSDGEAFAVGPDGVTGSERMRRLGARMIALAEQERAEIERMVPKVQRRVGGYNLDALLHARPNLAHLLVGSEGTLAVTTEVTLKLSPLPAHRVMGVCHFPSFRSAMETTRHLVALGRSRSSSSTTTCWCSGADIPLFRRTLADITRGSRTACCSSSSRAAISRACAGTSGGSMPAWPTTASRTPWSRWWSRCGSAPCGTCAKPASTS